MAIILETMKRGTGKTSRISVSLSLLELQRERERERERARKSTFLATTNNNTDRENICYTISLTNQPDVQSAMRVCRMEYNLIHLYNWRVITLASVCLTPSYVARIRERLVANFAPVSALRGRFASSLREHSYSTSRRALPLVPIHNCSYLDASRWYLQVIRRLLRKLSVNCRIYRSCSSTLKFWW